jgi:hypothetical protein
VTGDTNLSSDLYVNNTYQNVGIGANTTVGTYKLDVTGSIRSTGSILIGTNTLYANITSGNVGIGTITPAYTLDVTGNIRSTGNILIGTNTIYTNITSGNVGIGTLTPAYTLDVAGNIRSTGNLTTSNGNVNIGTGGSSTSNISYSKPGQNYVLQFDVPGIINLNPTLGSGGTLTGVGINNQAPAYTLDVTGNCNVSNKLISKDASFNGNLNVGKDVSFNGNLSVGGNLTVNGTNNLYNSLISKIYPIGSIYMNYTSNLNPSDASLLGFGSWTIIPAGRMLVSHGGSFGNLGDTGGSESIQPHVHRVFNATSGNGVGIRISGSNAGNATDRYNSSGNSEGMGSSDEFLGSDCYTSQSVSNADDKSNYPPYRVVSMWYRTA